MEIYNVRFLKEALDDLEEIVLYISQHNKTAALAMHDKILEKASGLETFPKRGRLLPDTKMRQAGYRALVVSPYLIFYRVLGQDVFIYRVIHGATNYPSLYGKMTQGL